ncbi:hypothetical protein LAZ40_04925 [Cereibacter sphaeroides]|uniref:hypothetical protein n=1 Tax=Cereibacter sphaeroides TaxID=1063 RepID=UPI001F2D559A|nr:hypothetical protein [Cereibacter sphaeroides]MCE6958399.1 hypothetical protein [Cereibacter sphaeroides]MCE6972266.1 hypothetical protein [Cereibacter sphaeroides]
MNRDEIRRRSDDAWSEIHRLAADPNRPEILVRLDRLMEGYDHMGTGDLEGEVESIEEWRDLRRDLAACFGLDGAELARRACEATGRASFLLGRAADDRTEDLADPRIDELSAHAQECARLEVLLRSRLPTAGQGEPAGSRRYPLAAEVFWRESTGEWVLEISGVINDTSLACRHPQPGNLAPEDVPGLPTHYAADPGEDPAP